MRPSTLGGESRYYMCTYDIIVAEILRFLSNFVAIFNENYVNNRLWKNVLSFELVSNSIVNVILQSTIKAEDITLNRVQFSM